MSSDTVLAGDIGGTHVRFARVRLQGGAPVIGDVWKRSNDGFPTFDAALAAYLREAPGAIAGAAFGAAGAVRGGHVDLLNRNWSIDAAEVAGRIGVDAGEVVLVNDFMAMARSAAALGPKDATVIAEGVADPEGSIGVGGPGTGFGVGLLRRLIGAPGYVVVGGEGGHQLFTPQTEVEWRLAEALRGQGIYVSNEYVAAGVGFARTVSALAGVLDEKLPALPLAEGEQQAEMIRLAHAGDRLALEFARLRARTTMAALGDLALSANTTGGVFIAGGVAARLEPWLRERENLARFYERGPRTALLKDVPIRLITSEAAPLIGAGLLWFDRKSRGWL